MRIFLSYASEDRPRIEPIRYALAEQGHDVFYDREDLKPGEAFDTKIRAAIERCDLFVCFLTPYTVDAGHFQYESDLVSFTHQVVGSARVNTILVPNPTFKVGVTNNVDLEVNVPFAGVHTFGSTGAPSSSLWGIGDTLARAKINLWGNDGGDSAAALIPFVKAPSAPIGIGNGAVEEGLIAPLSLSLPNSFTLLLVPEVDALKNSADNGRHGNFIFDINLSREVIKNLTAYVELWSDYNDDPLQKTTQLSFDAAVSWIVIPNVQLDVGANFGLTSATPALQVYAGLSQRF